MVVGWHAMISFVERLGIGSVDGLDGMESDGGLFLWSVSYDDCLA